MKKVSFDFDSTLDNEIVQKFVIELMNDGFDIHIVTSRPKQPFENWKSRNNPYFIWDNDDLYQISEILNIKKENIHFMGYKPKVEFFEDNKDFLFHLDDDKLEINEINSIEGVRGVFFDDNWKENCLNLIA